MGTTYSWYYVKNSGQTPEDIRTCLEPLVRRESAAEDEIRRMTAQWLDRLPPEQRELFASMSESLPASGGVYAAYRPGAGFFPVFATSICQGYTASSKDCEALSQIFRAPVFALAVFDSDVAFASIYDGERDLRGDYVRAPEGYMEYDEELYSAGFPDFLPSLCPPESREKVRAIWDKPDYIFADDKVWEIAGLIGIPMLYSDHPDRGMGLEGWELIDGEARI